MRALRLHQLLPFRFCPIHRVLLIRLIRPFDSLGLFRSCRFARGHTAILFPWG